MSQGCNGADYSYGKTHVFRLPRPYSERHEDDQDWRINVADLGRQLATVNPTDWKVRRVSTSAE